MEKKRTLTAEHSPQDLPRQSFGARLYGTSDCVTE